MSRSAAATCVSAARRRKPSAAATRGGRRRSAAAADRRAPVAIRSAERGSDWVITRATVRREVELSSALAPTLEAVLEGHRRRDRRGQPGGREAPPHVGANHDGAARVPLEAGDAGRQPCRPAFSPPPSLIVCTPAIVGCGCDERTIGRSSAIRRVRNSAVSDSLGCTATAAARAGGELVGHAARTIPALPDSINGPCSSAPMPTSRNPASPAPSRFASLPVGRRTSAATADAAVTRGNERVFRAQRGVGDAARRGRSARLQERLAAIHADALTLDAPAARTAAPPPISSRSVMPTLPNTVIVLLRTRSVSVSVSNGAGSSRNRFAVVRNVPSRRSWSSRRSKLDVEADTPKDARPWPGVKRALDEEPAEALGRPLDRAELRVQPIEEAARRGRDRHRRQVDDQGARDGVARGLSRGAVARRSPVGNAWFVTRKPTMSVTVLWARAVPAVTSDQGRRHRRGCRSASSHSSPRAACSSQRARTNSSVHAQQPPAASAKQSRLWSHSAGACYTRMASHFTT